MEKNYETIKWSYGYRYRGSYLALLFGILIPPLLLFLLLLNVVVVRKTTIKYIEYNGNNGWLIFWAIIFFPVAILLYLINGFHVIERERFSDQL